MAELLKSPAARRLMARLLEFSAFNALNPQLSALVEGRRAVGAWLIGEMNATDPTAYADLLREVVLRQRSGGLRDDDVVDADDEDSGRSHQ
jgi:hypothetical protein